MIHIVVPVKSISTNAEKISEIAQIVFYYMQFFITARARVNTFNMYQIYIQYTYQKTFSINSPWYTKYITNLSGDNLFKQFE